MKHSLTIYDDAVFYIQGLSKHLLEQEIFDSIQHCNSQEDFLEHFKSNPTKYVLHGSYHNNLHEIFENIAELFEINRKVKIAVIGKYFDIYDIRKLFEKGIVCYLDRDTDFEEFFAAMTSMKTNVTYICNSAKERMIGFISNQEQNVPQNAESLTKRELEVMKLICDGLSSKNISEQLFISINTVETHRKKILMKLNVKNSIGIVKYAAENNMLE